MARIAQGTEKPKEERRRAGEPRPPSFRGVVTRAVVIAALYGIFLAFVMKEKPLIAAAVAAFGFALMVPLGMMFDRMRYRSQLKRYRQQHGIHEPAARTTTATREADDATEEDVALDEDIAPEPDAAPTSSEDT